MKMKIVTIKIEVPDDYLDNMLETIEEVVNVYHGVIVDEEND